MIQQKWLQLQMKIAQDDYLKIAVWWGRNETFDSERFKSIKSIFLMREMNNFLADGWDFSPSPGFPTKVQGKGGTVHTWWVQWFCDIFGKKGDVWHMILGDNPAGHAFVLRDLVLIELSQISQDCVTECTLQKSFC